MRVKRKVKIDGAWVMASVPLDRGGRPLAHQVLHKGRLVQVDGGTFYLDVGHGAKRTHTACGSDPEGVKRAMRAQTHVHQLRQLGMDVPDAPDIVKSRRCPANSLLAMAEDFRKEPPTAFTKKTISKYNNALRTFADWAAGAGVLACEDVDQRIITRWIAHLQRIGLDSTTINPKVRIVLAELKGRGVEIKLDSRTLPREVERERDLYSPTELSALFSACVLHEYELFQVFLLTGMRFKEVAFLAWSDVDPQLRTIRVSRKRSLGFMPKAYHERIIPIPQKLLDMLNDRADRVAPDGAGLIFATIRGKGNGTGGRADTKMLDKLKAIARRAGLNCGCCTGSYRGKQVSCKTHAVCERWGLHKFRHTYATSMLRDGVDIVTVSRWLGHKDLATTRIYLRPLEAEMAQPQVERSTLARRYTGKTPQAEVRRVSRAVPPPSGPAENPPLPAHR